MQSEAGTEVNVPRLPGTIFVRNAFFNHSSWCPIAKAREQVHPEICQHSDKNWIFTHKLLKFNFTKFTRQSFLAEDGYCG